MLPAARGTCSGAPDWRSSALVMMTVRGVLSSWEASATNCFCWAQARSTGPTAQRARSRLMPRKAMKLTAPTSREVPSRFFRVVRSLEMPAKMKRTSPGRAARQKRRP